MGTCPVLFQWHGARNCPHTLSSLMHCSQILAVIMALRSHSINQFTKSICSTETQKLSLIILLLHLQQSCQHLYFWLLESLVLPGR